MLPTIPKLSQLAPGITRILGMNPSAMTLQGTNSYMLGMPSSKKRMLIDTSSPNIVEYTENLQQYFTDYSKHELYISDIILTHWHEDHIGSLSTVMNLASLKNWPMPQVHKFDSVSHPNCVDGVISTLKPDQVFDLSSFGMGNLTVLYTPGHTDDHICLLLSPENILFSADLILGHGSTVFENLTLYMNSLNEIKKLEMSLSMIFPAHGLEINEPIAKIAEYLKNRTDRINGILSALSTEKWQWETDIVKKVYSAEIISDQKLFYGALSNQFQALQYLLNQNKVECRNPTDNEKKSPASEFSFSGKLYKLKSKELANL